MSVGWRFALPAGRVGPFFSHQHFCVTIPKAAESPPPSEAERIYYPEWDVEDLEGYGPGGYHPTLIGDTFCSGRYKVIHKLGFGGYSTIWLARDQQLQRYVSLKILLAGSSQDSNESEILHFLTKNDSHCLERKFIPTLLDQFFFDDTARSITAQLIMGLNYLHANDVFHGDPHLKNFLLRVPCFDNSSTTELYERYGTPREMPTPRLDGKPSIPHAPSGVIYPMIWNISANEVMDPEIIISDYGTSFIVSETLSPTLHTPALYAPPEAFFNDHITPAADVWTLGVVLYEVMGKRPLFETFAWDPDDIIAEMVNTLGQLPDRWWNSWDNRSEFFNSDGSWVTNFKRISTPDFRRLHQRMWDMGRGETPETCEWDVAGGEFQALEDMLRAMMTFEPAERPTAKQLMSSEYMVKWAMPAWEQQMKRKRA
ncbi:CMGC/SRPK protein kinase [Emergomyces pasteurianus Ep9510]|uniref:non-specific serine/threonine protein kinase n=1 Tax=Emergomyces pasteurianus Ep9510 TaxID=1447872 RepID=A0A1J9PJK8_9EURO|nr:CMGC/SRPK protein kinase [Emergomyces pasteurianus Ep9510]